MSDGDAEEVSQGAFGAGPGETAGDGKTVFGRDGRGRERSDVEEDDDGGCGLEFP